VLNYGEIKPQGTRDVNSTERYLVPLQCCSASSDTESKPKSQSNEQRRPVHILLAFRCRTREENTSIGNHVSFINIILNIHDAWISIRGITMVTPNSRWWFLCLSIVLGGVMGQKMLCNSVIPERSGTQVVQVSSIRSCVAGRRMSSEKPARIALRTGIRT
jgi:hypothetical protein